MNNVISYLNAARGCMCHHNKLFFNIIISANVITRSINNNIRQIFPTINFNIIFNNNMNQIGFILTRQANFFDGLFFNIIRDNILQNLLLQRVERGINQCMA